MNLMDKILLRVQFGLLCLPVLAGPWFFGSWEMWWFWPFTVCISGAAFVWAIRLIIRPWSEYGKLHFVSRPLSLFLLSMVPFFLYALVRSAQADVYMDAERSFLLFLTPVFVGILVALGFNEKQLRLMGLLIVVNLACLGLYGIINHAITGSSLVLWAPGYAQYYKGGRATGTYFCPDHFAGIMELALCICLGWLFSRNKSWMWKISAAAVSLISLVCIVMSKSRGAGLTVIVLAIAALTWGFVQWPRQIRWYWRLMCGSLGLIFLVAFVFLGSAYIHRFLNYGGWRGTEGSVWQRANTVVTEKLIKTSRGRMYGGAVRAWKSEPIWGIGSGMHKNLWPHFAASGDGDREAGVWPTIKNDHFHSYEVHSDWLQLLEEYGVVGFLLFLFPVVVLMRLFLRMMKKEENLYCTTESQRRERCYFPSALGGLLALICMIFHSLGDFNLQMPATTWVLAAIIAIPLGLVHLSEEPRMGNGHKKHDITQKGTGTGQ